MSQTAPGFRFDRVLTLGLFRPLAALSPRGGLPILMYHGISDQPEPGFSPYYQVRTRPEIFREHLAQLAAAGYRTLALAEVAQRLAAGKAIDAKTVVITFDDGFRDFYTEAFPALQKHDFIATMFLPTAFIGESRRNFNGTECLTWAEVRELRQAGMEFGSHTVNHPKLVELEWRDVAREIKESKEQIEQALGEPATTFAYPYAFPQQEREFAQGLRNLLGENGYTCCATTEIGRVRAGDDPFRLKRLPANSLDDPAFFTAKLKGAYDWLAWPQALRKRLKKHRARPVPSPAPSALGTTRA